MEEEIKKVYWSSKEISDMLGTYRQAIVEISKRIRVHGRRAKGGLCFTLKETQLIMDAFENNFTPRIPELWTPKLKIHLGLGY